MKINKSLVLSSLISLVIATSYSGLAEAAKHHHRHHHGHHGHHGHHAHHGCCDEHLNIGCCTTARARCARGNADYRAGCRAAHSYVEQKISGSKSWNEGFTDCRFNIYRSCATELRAEKRECCSSGVDCLDKIWGKICSKRSCK